MGSSVSTFGVMFRAAALSALVAAAAVGVSRYTARKHFLPDVLVGGAIGYGIGRYVYKTHHDPARDARGEDAGKEDAAEPYGTVASRGGTGREFARSKFIPLVTLSFGRARRGYGLALAWSF